MQLPCIEVSQLAPSTSFYAAALQPLGLQYLTLESAAAGPDFAAFGCSRGPILHLRQVAKPAMLRTSSFRISAPSIAAIQAFYIQGMEANPASAFRVEHSADHSMVFDLDGNVMQAIYTELVCGPGTISGQFTLILNPQQETHLCQVLDSGNDVAKPCDAESINTGSSTKNVPKSHICAGKNPGSIQVKTEETNTPCGGISTVLGALMGVAAGAAAGAAVTYGIMSAGTPEKMASEVNSSQRSLAHNGQRSDTASRSGGLVDADHHKLSPARSHRIKFQQDYSTQKNPSTRPTRSVHESGVLQSRSNDIEYDDREGNGKRLVRIPRDAELIPVRARSRISASTPTRNALSTRRLALPPPADSSPGTMANLIEEPPSEKEHGTRFSAQSRVSSSPVTPTPASQRTSEPAKAGASSASKRDYSKKLPKEGDTRQKGFREKPSVSKRSSEPRSKEGVSLEAHSTTQLKESSHRPSKTASGRSGTSDVFDTRSHVLASKTDISASRNSSEDKRSRVSARGMPLPSTSDFFDARSHASARETDTSTSRNNSGEDKHSRASARDMPLPSSRIGTSKFLDTASHGSARKMEVSRSRVNSGEEGRSRVSARDIPLSSGRVQTSEFFDTRSRASAGKSNVSAGQNNHGDGKQSRVSARDVPLPSSRVGTNEFFDTVSHVSTGKARSSASCKDIDGFKDSRSHISARNVPLPASCVDCGSKVADRNSHVSARDFPLPASGVGTDHHNGSLTQISARCIPLPGSHVGSSHANWDDDARSIAPSDSISCIGSK